MSRVLERDTNPVDLAAEEAVTGRTTARALATAIALLLVSILVVTRSRGALSTEDTGADLEFGTGSVALTDDDAGSSLFAVDDMVPGRPEQDCIVVSYEGTVLPVAVRLSAEAAGALAPVLDVRVERGTGGAFHDCSGYAPDATVFDGTLAGLAGAPDGVGVATMDETPDARTFRFTFELRDTPDDLPADASASARFIWTADATELPDEG
ncbi:MAG: hypothetical protein KDB35_01450 [Acidimicrobiales bacterium]|nr:hypothetical protein [Acidimicrobiales bacterium]MCB1016761.1 hypothetical protein [Acidimicrobiales bacterium]MCB9373857.1 hypothetical protein [Microthrixaceae bacterium]